MRDFGLIVISLKPKRPDYSQFGPHYCQGGQVYPDFSYCPEHRNYRPGREPICGRCGNPHETRDCEWPSATLPAENQGDRETGAKND